MPADFVCPMSNHQLLEAIQSVTNSIDSHAIGQREFQRARDLARQRDILDAIKKVLSAYTERKTKGITNTIIYRASNLFNKDEIVMTIWELVRKWERFVADRGKLEIDPSIKCSEKDPVRLKGIMKSIHGLASLMCSKCSFDDKGNVEESVLESIGYDGKENFHSDVIAALLNPRVSGDMAKHLFHELITYAGYKEPKSDMYYPIVKREVCLQNIDQTMGEDKGRRRLDIYATSGELVLVIENKVFSNESEDQTYDYYNVLKGRFEPEGRKVFCLFLSPSGIPAMSSKFMAISYVELYSILSNILKNSSDNAGLKLWEFYVRELAATLVGSTVRASKFVDNYLRGVNYGAT